MRPVHRRTRGRLVKVAVLMGGNSAEREVSLNSGKAVVEALRRTGTDVEEFSYEGDVREVLPSLADADVVFLALHGGDGENGAVQRILENEGIVYTGSDPDASALAMNKLESKRVMIENNLPTPPWEFYEDAESFQGSTSTDRQYPLIVKPNAEGSTVGLTLVTSEADLSPAVRLANQFGNGVLLEQYIPGRELTVGTLGDEALPSVEIIPSHDYYDYECKYTSGMSNYICPAETSAAIASKLAQTSLTIHAALGCRHYSRVDFRLSPENRFYCLEVNTLPGLTATSLVPKAAAAVGLSFEELVLKICRMALDG